MWLLAYSTMESITSVDHEQFFADALGDAAAASDLYARARAAADPTPKVILHQTTRLVSLADWMDEVAPARPSLKIVFFVVLAEAIGKMAFAFRGTGESKRYVRRFFEELCVSTDQDRLARAFRSTDTTPHSWLTGSEAVDVLYNVRNSVVHRGEYFLFNLLEPGHTITITPYEGGALEATISSHELRAIIIRGAVAATEKLLSVPAV